MYVCVGQQLHVGTLRVAIVSSLNRHTQILMICVCFYTLQLKKDTMSVDGDAASIDIVSSSNTPSRLGTPLSYSLTPHFGTPLQGNSRPITPLLSSKNVNSMAGGGLVGASNGAAKGAASSVHHHSSKPDSNRSGSRLRHSSRLWCFFTLVFLLPFLSFVCWLGSSHLIAWPELPLMQI